MKIRTDFVTNSSSTSFILICSGELSKKDFFDLMGVSKKSPIAPLFEELYNQIIAHDRPTNDHSADGSEREIYLAEVKDNFSDEIVSRVSQSIISGKKIYFGELNSDNTPIETFFCVDTFEVENDKIYFNALDCTW